jgi:hypothetical protein
MAIFISFYSTYFRKFSSRQLITYTKTIVRYLSLVLKIAYASLYISAYLDKCLCYKLQISCLSKQALSFVVVKEDLVTNEYLA